VEYDLSRSSDEVKQVNDRLGMFVDTLRDPLLHQSRQDNLVCMAYRVHADGSRNPFLSLATLGIFQPG
jgi:hypothetical protein